MQAIRKIDIKEPTLDQLRVLLEIVDAGSFSAAARRLQRTQSVVSYTVSVLETTLGVRLFARGQRRPTLTEAGRALLADARRVAIAADELRARAIAMEQGLEGELALAVDVLFPTCRLVSILEAFARRFPTVTLRLRIEALGGVPQLVLDQECALGVSGPMATRFDKLDVAGCGSVDLIAVVAPGHALARHDGPITAGLLREHTQLVLTDRTRLTDGEDFGVISQRTWRLGDLGAKHALLLAGLGWGNMPEPNVRDDIAAGRLARLDWAEPARPAYAFVLIRRVDTPPGPAALWLSAEIAATADDRV